jgi:glutamate racemase
LSSYNPIGIFDSGYGGLTIFNEIYKELPNYDYIYIGDNARTPYGTRSYDVVYQYTLEAVKKLFDLGCHLIILACNTASAKALRTIQQHDLPNIDPTRRVLGVIRPSAEVIDQYTKSKHVGVLGTEGTVISESYLLEINKLFPEIKVVQEACPMWVPLVENNEISNDGSDYFVKNNINNLLQKDKLIDAVILGCTHYPLLIESIKKYLPDSIKIISQGEIVALSLVDYLKRHPEIDRKCSKNADHKFYTTESPEIFKRRSQIFLNKQIEVDHLVL